MKKHLKWIIPVVVMVIVIVLWKLGGLRTTVNQILPPIVTLEERWTGGCFTDEQGNPDMGWRFSGLLTNKGGSGYVTVAAELLKKDGSVWLRETKSIWMEGDTTKTVEIRITEGIGILSGTPASTRFYIE